MNEQGKSQVEKCYGVNPIAGMIANVGTIGGAVYQQAIAKETLYSGMGVKLNIATQKGMGGLSTTNYEGTKAAAKAELGGVILIGGDGVEKDGFALYEEGAILPYVAFGSGAEVWLAADEGLTSTNLKANVTVDASGNLTVKATTEDGVEVTIVGGVVAGKKIGADGTVSPCKVVKVRL